MDNGLANFIEDEMKLKIPSKIKPPLKVFFFSESAM